MQEHSIKIKILDREYNLKVSDSEAEMLRRVGEELNRALLTKKDRLKSIDKQDLLAMVAFDYVFESLTAQQTEQSVSHIISLLDKLISNTLLDENVP
jgi:cell division protein ZapA (FtsZ GTPase activity inhibitor)